jgi:hypothetical protein
MPSTTERNNKMTNQQTVVQIIAKVTAQIEADEAHTKQFTFTKFNRGTRRSVNAEVDGNFNGVAFEAVRFTKSSNGWRVSLVPKGQYYFEEGHGYFSTLKEAKRHALQYSGAA